MRLQYRFESYPLVPSVDDLFYIYSFQFECDCNMYFNLIFLFEGRKEAYIPMDMFNGMIRGGTCLPDNNL